MTKIDLDQLLKLASAATPDCVMGTEGYDGIFRDVARFRAAANPATVKALVLAVKELREGLEQMTCRLEKVHSPEYAEFNLVETLGHHTLARAEKLLEGENG